MSAGARAAWLQARRQGITGTDISAILGMNPYKNALDVWLEKTGQAPAKQQTEAMWWGVYLEEGIARRYRELRNVPEDDLLRGAAMARAFPKKRVQVLDGETLVHHPKHPLLLGTPDGVLKQELRGLEVKTASEFLADEWGEQGTDQVPMHYLLQCCFYLAITDYAEWDVAALIGGNRLGIYTVKRNVELEAELVDQGLRFWRDHVTTGVPPAIDGSESWKQHLGARYGKGDGHVIKADPGTQIYDLASEYRKVYEMKAELEQRESLLRNQCAALIAGADKTRGSFGTVGWVRPAATKHTDWKAVALSMQPSASQIEAHTTEKQAVPYVRAWWSKRKEAGQ